jgi:hypothetical protein
VLQCDDDWWVLCSRLITGIGHFSLYEKMKLEGLVPERVRTMPMKPNAILWMSLLGAARVHGN